jgi:hypothetical protein
MKMKKDKKIFKYKIIVKWPAICRNRSVETLQDRPDIVEQMNHFRNKLSNVCKLILKKDYSIDINYNMIGVIIWLESGQDLYDFIIRQPEFDWEILPELGVVNRLTGDYQKYNIIYTPSGITIT